MVFEHDYIKFPELTNRQLNDFGYSSPHIQITEDFRAMVLRVVDGDTIRLRTGFRDFDFPLRFLGINAPELSEGGAEAKEWLKERIEGKEVQILIDKKMRVGKYGRLLGKVLYFGLDMGSVMLSFGLVKPFGVDIFTIPKESKIFRLGQWF